MTAVIWHLMSTRKPVACCEECFHGKAFCRCEEAASEANDGS